MPSSQRHRVIAVEEHFSTAEFLDRKTKMSVCPGEEEERNIFADYMTDKGIRSRMIDPDVRLATMDDAGIDIAVLSFDPPGAQPYANASEATALARDTNDCLAEIVRGRPDRFGALGALAPQEPLKAADEIKRVMGSLKFNGIMISSHTQSRYLDDPVYQPLLAALEEENATVYLHPRSPSPGMKAPFLDYGMMASVWGFQAEAGIHAIRMILGGVFDRHPKLRIVLGHLGEAIPYWLNRLDNRFALTLKAGGDKLGMKKLQLTPSEYFKRNFWVTTSGMGYDAPFNYCLQQLGAEKILFAVDNPYEDSKDAMAFLNQAKMDESQRALVGHGNAERLFRIAPLHG